MMAKETQRESLQPAFRLWLEAENRQVVFDQVDAMLLRWIMETGSLSRAAKKVGLSYRAAWGRIKRLEKTLGRPLVVMRAGGRGGGGSRLTGEGEKLLSSFRRLRKHLFNALDEGEFWAHASYRLSARNVLPARIVGLEKGPVVSKLKLEVEGPVTLLSVITSEAVEDLKLSVGDRVYAVVKATDVIVGKGSPPPASGETGTPAKGAGK